MKNKNAARLGKLGGKSKSDAKRNAAKINGAKGGRPRKTLPNYREIPSYIERPDDAMSRAPFYPARHEPQT